MAIENKLRRVAEDDPRRCHYTAGQFQCWNESVNNSNFCPLHSAGAGTKAKEKQIAIGNYRLRQYAERVKDFATNPALKSLREEIGITRMLLEETLNKCTETNLLMLHSSRIGQLVNTISALVTSCHNLEVKSGALLDKNAVMVIAEQMINIIASHIQEPDLLNAISMGITKVLTDIAVDGD